MSSLADRLHLALNSMQPRGSQAGLTRACKVTNASVSNWFTGKTKSIEGLNLLRAAEYLGVRPIWLAAGEGPMRLPLPMADVVQIAQEPAPPEYREAARRETFLQTLAQLVELLPPNEWASLRVQLDGLSEGRFEKEAVLQGLRRLIGAQEWDGVTNRRSHQERRQLPPPERAAG